jgi:hypothetical protein
MGFWSEFGAEIIAIEDSDWVGWMESATTTGEVNFSSVESCMNGVLADLGDRSLALLHIQVHGNPGGMSFGSDYISVATFETFRAQFARLSGKFVSNAWVDFRACEIGQNVALMQRFNQLWGVGVVAGRGLQNNLYDANRGRYQVIFPDGRQDTYFFAPPWIAYNATRRLGRAVGSRVFGS